MKKISHMNKRNMLRLAAILCVAVLTLPALAQQQAGTTQAALSGQDIQTYIQQDAANPVVQYHLANPSDAYVASMVENMARLRHADKLQMSRQEVETMSAEINLFTHNLDRYRQDPAAFKARMAEYKERQDRTAAMHAREEARVAEEQAVHERASQLQSADPKHVYMEQHKSDPLVKRHLADPADAEAANALRVAVMTAYPEKFDLTKEELAGLQEKAQLVSFKYAYINELMEKGASAKRAETMYEDMPQQEKEDMARKHAGLENNGVSRQANTTKDTPVLIAQ